MAKFCPLFSGSTANCAYLGFAGGAVLIDAGSSFAALQKACEEKGLDLSEVSAVFITHSHSDHIKGLRVLLKKLNIPVVASAATLETLGKADILLPKTKTIEISENPLEISELSASFFKTSHDCQGSGGYSFLLPDGNKISICTDLGVITDEVKTAIKGSDLVMLESNHDLKMLKNGPYPPELKLRIMGDKGHLSNNICAATLKELFAAGTKRFALGHLSRYNNLPALASSAATSALLDLGAKKDVDYILNIAAPQDNEVIYL